MIRIILLSLLLVVSANADLLYSKNNRCVHDITPYDGHTGWCYVYTIEGYTACDNKAVLDDFLDGYLVNQSNQCVLEPDLAMLQISKDAHNTLMIMLALIVSAAFIFSIASLITI